MKNWFNTLILQKKYKIKPDFIFCILSFLLFFVVVSYKLTNSSLWFDEAIEFWYSTIVSGPLPYNIDDFSYANMYERIVSTYQPPLYNLFLFCWLSISKSEFWFRLSGVILSFIGMIGLYKTVLLVSSNKYLSSLSVIFTSFVYSFVSYTQECAEYTILLCTIFWLIYYFILTLQNPSKKNKILVIVFSILSMYSQYGAIFIVAPVLAIVLFNALLSKDKKEIKELFIFYGIAFIFFALPLYIFFLRPQILLHNIGSVKSGVTFKENSLLFDFFYNLFQVFHWNLFFNFPVFIGEISFIIFLSLSYFLIKSGKIGILFSFFCLISFILYYIAVKKEIYASTGYLNGFGNRYNLFFIPQWINLIFWGFTSLHKYIVNRRQYISKFFTYFFLISILCFSFFSWKSLKQNWNKDGIRELVDYYLNMNGYENQTLLYPMARCGFAYYLRQSKDYSDSIEKNIKFLNSSYAEGSKDYNEILNNIYDNDIPNEVLLITERYLNNDFNDISNVFFKNGYSKKEIFEKYGAKIIKFEKNGNVLPDLPIVSIKKEDWHKGLAIDFFENSNVLNEKKEICINNANQSYTLWGWAFDLDNLSDLDSLYIKIGKQVLKADYGFQRQDIADWYGISDSVGWQITIHSNFLSNVDMIEFFLVPKNKLYMYEPIIFKINDRSNKDS